MASIYELSIHNNSNDRSISTNDLEEIWYGSQIHPYIYSIDARFKIRDHIRQRQNEWKGEELSEKYLGKGLHKVFEAVVNEEIHFLIWEKQAQMCHTSF